MPWDEGCQRAVAIAMDEDRSAPDLFKEYVEYLQHSDMSGMTLAAYSESPVMANTSTETPLTSAAVRLHLSFLFQSGTLPVRFSCCLWRTSHSAADRD